MSSYFDNKPVFMEPQVNQYSSHMVMTNVSQESKTKIVNIDTKFRDDFNYDTACNLADYAISLPEPINNVCSMSVENLELPLSYYNASSALGNNCFKIINTTQTVERIVVIPDGEYTISSIITEVSSLLQGAAFSTFSISATAFNKTAIISSGDDFTIEFAVNEDGSFDKRNFKSKFGWMMGFSNLSYDIVGGSTDIFAERLCTISRPRVLYLQLDDFAQTKQTHFLQ